LYNWNQNTMASSIWLEVTNVHWRSEFYKHTAYHTSPWWHKNNNSRHWRKHNFSHMGGNSAIVDMAVQYYAMRLCTVEWGYLSLTNFLSHLWEIIINHTLLKSRFFGLHFCCTEYGSNFNHCDEISSQRWEKNKVSAIMRFKVTNFGTNGKLICNFLCVNNMQLISILHRFRDN